MSTPEQDSVAKAIAKLTAHINGPKHGGPFVETEDLLTDPGLHPEEIFEGLVEWHREEHVAVAVAEADDWEAE